MEEILRKVLMEGEAVTEKGRVASYIPELRKGDAGAVGIGVLDLNGRYYGAGRHQENFTLQSITKVVALLLALEERGKDKVFQHVHMEPTGDAFNSIVSLEVKNPKKPFNPMINAGAMAVTSLIKGSSREEKLKKILAFSGRLFGRSGVDYDKAVFASELATGDRNRSLAYFMKGAGIIRGDVEEILDLYFMQCSILGNCRDIATLGATLAADGLNPTTRERVVDHVHARIVKTIMTTCGMYDASGEFAVDVGMPGKSGVGGGILAVAPKRMGVGTFGPGLDRKGNSLAGTTMLRALSKALDLSIF